MAKCWVCLKDFGHYEAPGQFVFFVPGSLVPMAYTIKLCEEDFDWSQKNVDSAEAIINTRINNGFTND